MGIAVLTDALGPHPLFDGISRLTLTGLNREPVINADSGRVTVNSPGFSTKFTYARFKQHDEEIIIHLGASE